MHEITEAILKRAQGLNLAANDLGNLPHSYTIRAEMAERFQVKASVVDNYLQAAVRIMRGRERKRK